MSRRSTTAAVWRGSQILVGNALTKLKELPSEVAQTCVTSPPYWGLRDYGVEGQLGLETTPEEYVERLVEIMREVRRVLRPDGTLWLNLADSYTGSGTSQPHRDCSGGLGGGRDHGTREVQGSSISSAGIARIIPQGFKPKDLVGIPWRVAFALQADGWYLRSDIIWAKPNPMPESVTDRPTQSHEYIFLLSKERSYYYDADAIRGPHAWYDKRGAGMGGLSNKGTNKARLAGQKHAPSAKDGGGHPRGKNRRDVWTVPTKPYPGAHFACFPPKLIEPCILAGSPVGGVVLDPFLGSGTTAEVAIRYARRFIGIELNPEYIQLAKDRLSGVECRLPGSIRSVREGLGF
jgi:DNA modification methylase